MLTHDHVCLGAAAGKDGPPPGALLGVGGATLHAVSGVGHGEDDGVLVELAHGLQHLLGENWPRARQPNQGRRLHLRRMTWAFNALAGEGGGGGRGAGGCVAANW